MGMGTSFNVKRLIFRQSPFTNLNFQFSILNPQSSILNHFPFPTRLYSQATRYPPTKPSIKPYTRPRNAPPRLIP